MRFWQKNIGVTILDKVRTTAIQMKLLLRIQRYQINLVK